MKQRQMMLAFQMGMGKERFWYYSVFVGIMYVLLPIGAVKKHNPAMLVGLLPMTLGWTFQYDMLYGDMQLRARKEAARLIKEEPERFFLPENNGILKQDEYNKLLGLPEDYRSGGKVQSIFGNH